MSKFPLLAFALSAVPALAIAETPMSQSHSQHTQHQQAPAKPAKEKKICKMTGEQEIGSRFGAERVCKTAAEWNKLEQQQNKK